MNRDKVQFFQVLYSLSELVEERVSSTGSRRRYSLNAREVTKYFRQKIKEAELLKSTKSDNIWWLKTNAVFESAVKHGLTKEDLIGIIDLAFEEVGYRKYFIYPKGLIRNFESKWLMQRKTKETISRKNINRFLGD